MYFAARSLTEPPGFRNSALPRIVHPVSSDALRSLISGVLPTASTKSERISIERPRPRSAAVQSPPSTRILIFSETTGGGGGGWVACADAGAHVGTARGEARS